MYFLVLDLSLILWHNEISLVHCIIPFGCNSFRSSNLQFISFKRFDIPVVSVCSACILNVI